MFKTVKELGTKLILPSIDLELYEEKRQIWNSTIDNKPAAIVVCENEHDVFAAVKLAKKLDWSVSVKSGGDQVFIFLFYKFPHKFIGGLL